MGHRTPRREQPLLRRVKGCLGAVATSKRSYFLGKLVLMSQDTNTKFS